MSPGPMAKTRETSYPHYPEDIEVKPECLTMYVKGSGFRAIERVKGVHHTTIIHWVKQTCKLLPDAYDPETIPQVGELDELQTFVGSKKNFLWLWTAVNHFSPGILAWVIGDRSSETSSPLWHIVKSWECFFGVAHFGDDGGSLVSQLSVVSCQLSFVTSH